MDGCKAWSLLCGYIGVQGLALSPSLGMLLATHQVAGWQCTVLKVCQGHLLGAGGPGPAFKAHCAASGFWGEEQSPASEGGWAGWVIGECWVGGMFSRV